MAITRGDARTLIRQQLDDPNLTFISDATLDILASFVIDQLWAQILEWRDDFTSQDDTISAPNITAPGFIDLSAAGPLTQRYHKLQTLTVNQRVYRKIDLRDIVLQNNTVVVATDLRYTWFGQQLHMFPYDTASPVEIRYSFKPAQWRSLANDNAVVPNWPDGHELALVYAVATNAISKGAREENTELAQLHKNAMDNLKSYVKNRQIGMVVPWTEDSPEDWGGV